MAKRQSKQNRDNVATAQRPPKRVSGKSLRRKRKIKQMIGFITLLAVIGVGVYFAMNTLFVVKRIEISGSELFTQEEILDFMAIPKDQNIFTLKSEELSDKLYEEFTYLESAEITKRMPDRIEVKLTDSRESYYTYCDDEYKIYSQSFKPLRNSDDAVEGAVLLNFNIADEATLGKAKELIELLAKNELKDITAITVEADSILNATYADRFEIEFGTMLEIEYKIKLCKKILEEKIPSGEMGIIDATTVGEAVYKRQ